MTLGSIQFYNIFIRDLRTEWYRKKNTIKLSISINIKVDLPASLESDQYKYVVCYDRIVIGARKFICNGKIKSPEFLASMLARYCFEDDRVREVYINLSSRNKNSTDLLDYEVTLQRNPNLFTN